MLACRAPISSFCRLCYALFANMTRASRPRIGWRFRRDIVFVGAKRRIRITGEWFLSKNCLSVSHDVSQFSGMIVRDPWLPPLTPGPGEEVGRVAAVALSKNNRISIVVLPSNYFIFARQAISIKL
jgi:hypothetical protein